jgi:hypothetical protein
MPPPPTRKKNPGRRGTRRAWARVNSLAASTLAVVLAVLVSLLAIRLDWSFELPLAGTPRVSARTRDMLARTEGTLRVTCYVDRNHALLRPVARLLKGLQAAAAMAGGGVIEIVTVDPRRDLAAATRLAHLDTPPNTLIFEGHGRRMVVPVADLQTRPSSTDAASRPARFTGESVCAAVLAQLGRAAPPVVYWLVGHGELALEDYSPLMGASDLAREIRRDGYELRPLACWETHRVPADADVLIVAGPRRALAAEERGAIEEFLSRGGRLLFLAPPDGETGLEAILDHWGVRVTCFTAVTPRTLFGQGAVIVHYGEHPATRNFRNTVSIFAAPRCLVAGERTATNGVDRTRVTLLALTGPDGWADATPAPPYRFDAAVDLPGPVAVAATAERGGAAGSDVAFRPTRIAVFGESAFAANELLGARSGANRDLLLNVLNWLAGIDAATAPSTGGDAVLTTGLDQRGWLVLAVLLAMGMPLVVLAFGVLVVAIRMAGER